jgi:23S rRNA (guanosine2251-2'-O)-methyltransferase
MRPPRPPAADTTGLLGEDEELICGRHPVEEAFAARREAVRLLIVPERRAALDALAIHATTLRIPVVEVEGGTLTALAGFDGHQGVALVCRPRQTADIDAILAHARQRGAPPFVLILDSLEDPQNFGTLLRSAEACGVDGVIYPTRHAAPLSPAAIKASAGATEHLLLAPVDDLAGMLVDLHSHGLRLVGADEEAALDYSEADLRGPLALVVGSEGRGISGPVRRRLDLVVRIPMRGRVASLNAAVAGSILLFAAAGQRPHEGAAPQPPAPVEIVGDQSVPDSREADDPSTPAAVDPELLPGDG